MTITNISDPNTLTGAPVHGSDGAKLGKVESVYLDNDSNQPEWVSVKSGLFGSHVSIVPLSQASWDDNALTVPWRLGWTAVRPSSRQRGR
jgi:sporulation protein YlmC with PRC-barrel domain